MGAVDDLETGAGHGLQQRQRRHHLARRQQPLLPRRQRGGIRLALAACVLQQLVQARRQHLAVAAQMHIDHLCADQCALPARPVCKEACDPVRRLGALVAGGGVLARNTALTLACLRQLAQPRDLGQRLFQLAVALADARHQLLLADLDHRQMHLGGQGHALERLVQRNAQMLRPERIAVAIDAQPTGDETQIPIEPHQLRPPLVLQRAGKVAYRQAHVQVLLRQQGQAGGAPSEGALGRQRTSGFHPLPRLGQMAAKACGDRFALLAQGLDRFHEIVLRRARVGRQPEQRLGQRVLHIHKRVGQRHQHHLADLIEQVRIAAGQRFGSNKLGHWTTHWMGTGG
ncbi:hypothetical protein Xkhy_06470 [Xanthomonas axonopodis pv. khayae]|nr:hypothetical protein Xkhy_06470 [Xanthomonas axonopodis pv. khayae]